MIKKNLKSLFKQTTIHDWERPTHKRFWASKEHKRQFYRVNVEMNKIFD
jgi:hypothetical protein